MRNHLKDVEKILMRLQEVHLTLSSAKSSFAVPEIQLVGYLCGTYGRKPSPAKLDGINDMRECSNVSEVRRFLGACGYYRSWIPHYAHQAEPLYRLLRKDTTFEWGDEQSNFDGNPKTSSPKRSYFKGC